MAERGRFVGVGIDRYVDGGLVELEHAVADVVDVARRLRQEFDGEPLTNPTQADIETHLKAVKGQADGGSLVLMWSGHGIKRGRLRLPTTDDAGGVAAAEVVHRCVESGANQLLLIIDTCQAGAGLLDATELISQLFEEAAPAGDHVWFGILASCSAADVGARDGAFGTLLRKLLAHGPDSADQKRRWSRHNRLIRGDDLGQALLEEWSGTDQQPEFLRRGSAWYLLPNPLYDEAAPQEVVEHLLRAARGGDSSDERSWFAGRTAEVDTVVSWVTAATPGVRVVTGSAGTGKSAIVGRVVCLSNPEERARLEAAGRSWTHADPSEGSVTAHVHARGLSVERVAELVDGQLVRADVLPTLDAGRRNAAELVGAVQRAVEGGAAPPVVVVDGLDEARGQSFTIATDLLARLAQHACVVVSTRPLTRHDDDTTLLAALRATEALDLDDATHQRTGRDAIHTYVSTRLTGVDDGMDPVMVADHLVGEASSTEDRPFLLARVIVDQLRAAPVSTSSPNWQTHVARSIEEAFDADLRRVDAPRGLPPGLSAGDAARALLTALTWALGAGFPEEEWLTVAGPAFDRGHVSWVLDQLGRYVVQDGESGVAVYRLAHQSLADHIRPPYRPTGDEPFDPAAVPVGTAILARYRALLASGLPARTPGYLWRYAWRHAANAGVPGLDQLRDLAATTRDLRLDVGLAAMDVADTSALWGRRTEAVAPTEEAVDVYRRLSREDPAFGPNVAGAMVNLGLRYRETGRPHDAVTVAEEAAASYRSLAANNPAHRPDLAMSLTNLGLCYRDVGRPHDAVAAAEEAASSYRALAEDNPAHRPDLTVALVNLGLCYRDVGRAYEGVAVAEEAAASYRVLVVDSPAHLPNLAMALINLGLACRDVGRPHDAAAASQEAVGLYRTLAADNPAHLPNLTMALINLGACYREIGRPQEALIATEEAAAACRELTVHNPAYLPNLAMALINLGLFYRDIGRPDAALVASEEAAMACRALASGNPAHLPTLAMALNNLGLFYREAGRPHDAITVTEEAAAVCRELTVDNPAHRPTLATALANLGLCYRETGRPEDALAASDEAAASCRVLAADNPAHLPTLATALINLGLCYSDLGRTEEALAVTEETVTSYRALAADNPVHLPSLATALNNLGAYYRDTGRSGDAIAPFEEAVALSRDAVAGSPAHLPSLATALNNLGACYRETGRAADAVELVEEAVALSRELAADIPAQEPTLAGAVDNLGQCYAEVGRPREAVVAVEEAIALYLSFPEDGRYLPDLADALIHLDGWLTEAGEPARAEQAWRDAFDRLDADGVAILLLRRAIAADTGDPRTAEWLHTIEVSGDRGLLAGAHRSARRHWGADPDAWAAVWRRAGGGPLPAWLDVDPELLAVAAAWVDTPTYQAERDYLDEHPELLDEAADVAVEEALLTVVEDSTQRYRDLRVTARSDGIEQAYRPLLLGVLLGRFTAAEPAEQRRLLAERRADLLDDLVIDHIAALATAQDAGGEVVVARALLQLAGNDPDGSTLAAVFDAMDDPDRFAALLPSVAAGPHAGPALAVVATIVWHRARTLGEAALAGFFVAVGVAIAPAGVFEIAPADALRAAMADDPDRKDEWIRTLAGLAATHPAVLPLIGVLTEEAGRAQQ